MWLFRIHRCISSILNGWLFFLPEIIIIFGHFHIIRISWLFSRLSVMLIVIRQGQFSNNFPWWKSYINRKMARRMDKAKPSGNKKDRKREVQRKIWKIIINYNFTKCHQFHSRFFRCYCYSTEKINLFRVHNKKEKDFFPILDQFALNGLWKAFTNCLAGFFLFHSNYVRTCEAVRFNNNKNEIKNMTPTL